MYEIGKLDWLSVYKKASLIWILTISKDKTPYTESASVCLRTWTDHYNYFRTVIFVLFMTDILLLKEG